MSINTFLSTCWKITGMVVGLLAMSAWIILFLFLAPANVEADVAYVEEVQILESQILEYPPDTLLIVKIFTPLRIQEARFQISDYPTIEEADCESEDDVVTKSRTYSCEINDIAKDFVRLKSYSLEVFITYRKRGEGEKTVADRAMVSY